jgi:hypothetical protein
MGKIKDTAYFVVHGWMLNQLNLKGTTLQVFAIIHGFSHSEENEFKGSLQYLCEFTGSSRSTVIRSLLELEEKGIIVKREVYENGVKFNRYKSSVDMVAYFDMGGVKMTPPPCQNDTTPGVKMTPHNIVEDNIKDNIEVGKRKRFTPPTVEEVAAYCRERNNRIDPQTFVDFYSSKGWVVGKSKMKDWKAAVRTWEKRDGNSQPERTVNFLP